MLTRAERREKSAVGQRRERCVGGGGGLTGAEGGGEGEGGVMPIECVDWRTEETCQRMLHACRCSRE